SLSKMMVLSLFIIGHMGLFVYTQKGSITSIVVLPTTEIIEPFCESPMGSFFVPQKYLKLYNKILHISVDLWNIMIYN
ncbi:hypothetical protein ACVRWD_08215, partial [Streptococcus varani]